MMFSIVLFFLNLNLGFSVTFERSNEVIILFWLCTGEGLNGKIVIEGTSSRYEKDFYLDQLTGANSGANTPRGWFKAFPVNLEENSTVTIQRFRENKIVKTDTLVWNNQTFHLSKKFDYLEIFIQQCSLIGPANKFETIYNCQSVWPILSEDVQPVGFLAVKFYPKGDKELSVSFNSKWEEQTYIKGDFHVNIQCLGITSIYDENNLMIRIGNGKETKLSIKNPRERQIFYYSKLRVSYVPYVHYFEKEYNYIFYINNTNGQEKFFRSDEIIISIFDNEKRQTRIASTRLLERVSPGYSSTFQGKIMAFQQAQSVIVQVKSYLPYRARDIGVFPIIYSQINHEDRIMVIPGSREKLFAVLLLSEKPITSLTDLYNVKIKAHPDVLRFEFCVKIAGKTCEFKYTDREESYQQFSVSLNLIENIFLRCGCKEWILPTQFQTEEITTSIDISGVQVEADIRRISTNQNILRKRKIDESMMIKLATMKNEK